MIDTIPNPVETADLLTALAQLEVAGRRVTIFELEQLRLAQKPIRPSLGSVPRQSLILHHAHPSAGRG